MGEAQQYRMQRCASLHRFTVNYITYTRAICAFSQITANYTIYINCVYDIDCRSHKTDYDIIIGRLCLSIHIRIL